MEKRFLGGRWDGIVQKFVLFLVLILMAGCVSHIKELRDAKDQFNMAATLENQLKFGPEQQDVMATNSQIAASYQLTVNMLDTLIRRKKDDLLKDNLLGTAYTLKAYAEWRLGDYDGAVKTSTEALGSGNNALSSQDLALIIALRGLIKNDQAFSHMNEKDYPYRNIKTLLKEAVADISKGFSTTQKNDAVRSYLILSELVALKNWTDLRGEPENFVTEIPQDFNKRSEIADWCESAVPVWDMFTVEIKALKPDDAGGLIHDWGTKLGMPETCQ